MLVKSGFFLASMLAAARAQNVGTQTAETHPKMTWQKCTGKANCSNVNGEVVIDANWRWLHTNSGTTNCYDGNKWSGCSSTEECSKCALEGADYSKTYGASTSGNGLTLKFLTKHEYGTNIGSRMYLMNGASKYQMFNLPGNEFTFDVDLSTVGCGLNAALYFVAMEEDGGMKSYPANKAGAKYGTGYCDAQCARDLKFVGGKANSQGWKPSENDANAGVGPMGGCCAEIDIWESNSESYAFTPHPCGDNKYHVCEDTTCGGTYSDDRFAGNCDANGCDLNAYRIGNTDFYGKGMTVDTSKKFTVVTQFESDKLTQFFVQNGKKIEVPAPTWEGLPADSAITADYCSKLFTVFDDRNRFEEVGGWSQLQKALAEPMVLVMSIWDDHYSNMLWLDSVYPPEKEGTPGGARGRCSQDSGAPSDVEANQGSSKVTYSNIRFGPVGSTVNV